MNPTLRHIEQKYLPVPWQSSYCGKWLHLLFTDVQLRCRPIVFWKWPAEPEASQDIQFGMNIEAKVIAVAADDY